MTAAVCFAALLVLGLFSAINQSAGRFAPGAEESAAARAADGGVPSRRAETRVSNISEDTQRVGGSLYRYGALPFEIASVLLLVAIVGSVLLARTSKQELAADDIDPQVVSELSAAGELTPAEIEAAARRAQADDAWEQSKA